MGWYATPPSLTHRTSLHADIPKNQKRKKQIRQSDTQRGAYSLLKFISVTLCSYWTRVWIYSVRQTYYLSFSSHKSKQERLQSLTFPLGKIVLLLYSARLIFYHLVDLFRNPSLGVYCPGTGRFMRPDIFHLTLPRDRTGTVDITGHLPIETGLHAVIWMPLPGLCWLVCCRQGFSLLARDHGEKEEEESFELRKQDGQTERVCRQNYKAVLHILLSRLPRQHFWTSQARFDAWPAMLEMHWIALNH